MRSNRTASGSERVRAAADGPPAETLTRSLPLAVLLKMRGRARSGRVFPTSRAPFSIYCSDFGLISNDAGKVYANRRLFSTIF